VRSAPHGSAKLEHAGHFIGSFSCCSGDIAWMGWLLFLDWFMLNFLLFILASPSPRSGNSFSISSGLWPFSSRSTTSPELGRHSSPFLCHLAHHAPHRWGHFQSGQGRRIGKILERSSMRLSSDFCHAHVRKSPAYVLAFTMRASHAATAVFENG